MRDRSTGLAVEKRQVTVGEAVAAVREAPTKVESQPRGTRKPLRSPDAKRGGWADRKEGEFPGGNRRVQEANAGAPKGDGKPTYEPNLLGDGTPIGALTLAFVRSTRPSSGYIPDQRKLRSW